MEHENIDLQDMKENGDTNSMMNTDEIKSDKTHSNKLFKKARKIFSPDESNTLLKELLEKFPELSNSDAKKIDKKMKSHLQVFPDLEKEKAQNYLTQRLKLAGVNVEPKSNKSILIGELTDKYIENEKMGLKTEKWASLYGFFVTNVLMLLSLSGLSNQLSNIVSIFVCGISVVALSLTVKHTSEANRRISIFLNTVNKTISLLTLTEMVLFYTFCYVDDTFKKIFLLLALVVLLFIYVYSTIVWYIENLKSIKEANNDEK